MNKHLRATKRGSHKQCDWVLDLVKIVIQNYQFIHFDSDFNFRSISLLGLEYRII